MSRADTAETRGASPLALVRPDLREFAGYRSARVESVEGDTWLNANESPWANLADRAGQVQRYPAPQPPALRGALAQLYGCQPEQLLASRGSDEGIDLLVRTLCRPGADAIVVTPPTFGMYAVCARLHATTVVEVALIDGPEGFACDFHAVAKAAQATAARLVFLCSPGNPTGTLLPPEQIIALARQLENCAVVVVDEAYIEYADGDSVVGMIAQQRNLAVLRTLSKAHALAAARVGCVIADADLIAVMQRCQAPYPLPQPCVELACRALDAEALSVTAQRVIDARHERTRLQAALRGLPGVAQVYPSQGNFLLVRFEQPQRVFARLLQAGIVVRDMRHVPALHNALRISIGTPEQNAAVLDALASAGIAA